MKRPHRFSKSVRSQRLMCIQLYKLILNKIEHTNIQDIICLCA